mmetsp:Transcript_14835/g.29767  ORF Transcript_14835/g.29767 Transcript_14835/m.29767 type:complete len:218 (-) Transcript_14835:133-786(-)
MRRQPVPRRLLLPHHGAHLRGAPRQRLDRGPQGEDLLHVVAQHDRRRLQRHRPGQLQGLVRGRRRRRRVGVGREHRQHHGAHHATSGRPCAARDGAGRRDERHGAAEPAGRCHDGPAVEPGIAGTIHHGRLRHSRCHLGLVHHRHHHRAPADHPRRRLRHHPSADHLRRIVARPAAVARRRPPRGAQRRGCQAVRGTLTPVLRVTCAWRAFLWCGSL